MKKISIFIIILFLLSGCNRSYHSLAEAVQSHWKTPIQIVNQDEDKQLVYYLDSGQHILGVYHYKDGKYSYGNKESLGTRFSSGEGLRLPFLVRADYFKGIGNIIHGAIKTDEQEVEKFVIQYKNGEHQEIMAKNNTFIIEAPTFLATKIEMFQAEIENVIGYDNKGNIIESYN